MKKRLARPGAGKRGGFRLIVAYRQQQRLVFLFLFGKNERDSISEAERRAMLLVGDGYMRATADALGALITMGELVELADHDT